MFDLTGYINPYGDGCLLMFGFMLPKKQETEIIQISKKIADKERVKYVLDDRERLPILRLYETVVPGDNLETVKAEVAKLVTTANPIEMKWAEVEETETEVILWGEENEELMEFQYKLMEKVNQYREGYYKQKYNSYDLDDKDRQNLNKWGWLWGTDYSPYVVLARPVDKFNLLNFDITWDHKWARLDSFILAMKTAPGSLTHRQVIELNG